LVHGAKQGGGWAASTTEERVGDMQRIGDQVDDLHALDEADVEGHLGQRVQQGASAAAINNDIVAINGLARALWDLEDREGEPPQWSMRKRDVTDRVWLSDDQVDELLDYRHDDRAVSRYRRAVIHFALESALRPSEGFAVTLDKIDREDGTPVVHIDRTAKYGIKRPLYFSDEFLAPTRPFGAYVRWVRKLDRDDDELWITPYGPGRKWGPHPPSYNSWRNTLWQVSQAVGVKVNWQIARRTRAMQLLEDGWSLPQVSYQLGHRDVSTTMEYLNITSAAMRDLVGEIPPRSLFGTN